MKNIILDGQTYSGISEVSLPISGGTALFKDKDEIIEPTGSLSITANGKYDVTQFANANVNVPTSGEHNPEISVAASGLVTAACGGESTTHQLSSADDADFIEANIKKDVVLFGKTGSYEGGGSDLFHEHGTVAYHSGTKEEVVTIPYSDGSFTQMLVIVRAIKTWYKVNDEWVEQATLDFSQITTDADMTIGFVVMKSPCAISGTKGLGAGEFSFSMYGVNAYTHSGTNKAPNAMVIITPRTFGDTSVDLTISNRYVCNEEVGITYEYDVYGWN